MFLGSLLIDNNVSRPGSSSNKFVHFVILPLFRQVRVKRIPKIS